MTKMMVSDFKAHFSDALDKIRNGKSVEVLYGRRGTPVGVFMPYKKYKKLEAKPQKREVGWLEGVGKLEWVGDGKFTQEDIDEWFKDDEGL
ncbi:MAG: type II toxin-antitoxin system prevent-host-death family antitoxin [Spirochaetaceae bacterium]|jgi:prevent-host-death family protein|nr:type II toxin-antitoxin system prevent-host-death family antitoxin [Spirochaetaceae bacterium]